MKILGLGNPKTGTTYTANILLENGINVGHEKMMDDGMVSWLACTEDDNVFIGDGAGKITPDKYRVFLVARNPYDTIKSIIRENEKLQSFEYRARRIEKKYGVNIRCGGPTMMAVSSMWYWYQMCLEHNPEFIFRVEHDIDKLSDFVGKKLNDSINRNIHSGGYNPKVEIDYLPEEWKDKLLDLSKTLGY